MSAAKSSKEQYAVEYGNLYVLIFPIKYKMFYVEVRKINMESR